MSDLFHQPITIPDDPFPDLTAWIQKTRTRIPDWKPRPIVLPDYDAWNLIQEKAVENVENAFATGHQTVVGCGVTGFGKTRVAEMLVKQWTSQGKRSIFYTHRRAIFQQTHERFMLAGIDHGCRAAGYSDREKLDAPVQLAMIASERAAIKTHNKRDFHDAHRIIIDEAHANAGGFAKKAFQHHQINEANVLLLTATPVNLGGHDAKLIYFGRPSEMRKIHAIVPAEVLAPNEVDLSDIKKVPGAEFNPDELSKRFMVQQVVGSVIEHLLEENPELRPTLLFAPDVEASLWFCDELRKAGISACSIDGEDCYFGEKDADGQRIVYRSNEKRREYAKECHKLGIISVVCNRFVFVMGVDWPFVEHIVFATAFGGAQTWLQACGRGLRAYPDSGKSLLKIQDHGASWYKFPNPNADVDWDLDDTPKELEKKLKDARESGKEQEPLRCPRCSRAQGHDAWKRNHGKCCFCGFEFPKSERIVIQTDGKLKKVTGPIYKVKIKKTSSDAQKTWDSYFWRLRNAHSDRPMNFRQLMAWFTNENANRFAVRNLDGVMMIRDVATGVEQRLARTPSPDSPVWNKAVKHTDFWELQKPPKKQVASGKESSS